MSLHPREGLFVEYMCKSCRKVKEEDMSDNQLELLSMISEFNSLHEFMGDEQLDRALALVVKLIVKAGEIPTGNIPAVIVELQALATKFAILASYYGNMGKTEPNASHKKNVYYTMKDAIGKLVDALKYRMKEY